MARTGRPTKLTPAVKAEVCDAIRLGVPYEHAARAAGIADNTLRSWRERGEAGEQPFADFLRDVNRAESEGLVSWLRRIDTEDSWQRFAWKAERRFPHLFALRQRLEHTGADGGPIKTENTDTPAVDRDTLRAALALLDEARADTVREAEAAVSEAARHVNGTTNGNGSNGNGRH